MTYQYIQYMPFPDSRFADFFRRPTDYYTVTPPTEINQTVVTAELRKDFNYDDVVTRALTNSSSAYARYRQIGNVY